MASCRFASSTEEEIEKLLDDKDSHNTKRATKVARELFYDYLKEKNIVEPKTTPELVQILKSFYVEARKRDGLPYSLGSLKSLRFGLNRHFKATRGIDIMKEPEFTEANKVFAAKCVQLKREGVEVQHKPPIEESDLKKLYDCGVFDTQYPKTLLYKVFFETMLCLCRRTPQNMRQLRKSDFVIGTDAMGAKFVSKVVNRPKSNYQKEEDEMKEGGGIMCATGGPWCPVASFEKYLQHLNPENEFLFQRARKSVTSMDCYVWYDHQVIGERALAEMMKEISKQAGLSREYTNHSIRATSVNMLNKAIGLEGHRIVGFSSQVPVVATPNRTLNSTLKTEVAIAPAPSLTLKQPVVVTLPSSSPAQKQLECQPMPSTTPSRQEYLDHKEKKVQLRGAIFRQLRELKDLKDADVLSETEFESQKEILLNELEELK